MLDQGKDQFIDPAEYERQDVDPRFFADCIRAYAELYSDEINKKEAEEVEFGTPFERSAYIEFETWELIKRARKENTTFYQLIKHKTDFLQNIRMMALNRT